MKPQLNNKLKSFHTSLYAFSLFFGLALMTAFSFQAQCFAVNVSTNTNLSNFAYTLGPSGASQSFVIGNNINDGVYGTHLDPNTNAQSFTATELNSGVKIHFDVSTVIPTPPVDYINDYYTYDFSIHTSYRGDSMPKTFTIDTTTASGTNTLTNYESLTTAQTNTNLVLNSANGEVTYGGGAPLEAEMEAFEISFRSTETISRLSFNILGIDSAFNFNLAEIDLSANVEQTLVPEPSTYALLLGFISFAFIAFKKRKVA